MKRKDLTSALSVAGQLVNFLGKQTVDDQLKSMGPGDVLIEPDLGDHLGRRASSAPGTRSASARRRRGRWPAKLDALQPAAGAVRGAARRSRSSPKTSRSARSPTSASRACERTNPEVLRRPGASTSRASRSPRRRSARTCAASTAAATSRASSYHIDGDSGPRAMVITPQREAVGAGLPALRARPRERLPGRQRVQRAGPVPQDLAQPAGRGVDHRGAGRPGHAPVFASSSSRCTRTGSGSVRSTARSGR